MDAVVTFVLVIETFSLFATEPRIPSSRTRDLTEAACLTLAQEVKGPSAIAYCYRTGDKDPGWGSWVWGWRERIKEPICAHGGGSCSWPLLPGRRRV